MSTPYDNAPPRAFWKNYVTGAVPQPADIYRKKFDIGPSDRIATAGSCFAQHIAREMRQNGYKVLDVEPAPAGLSAERKSTFGYGMFSARYGNIYTARQLLQLAREAVDGPQRETVWQKDGRWYDPFRPSVEPGGLDSREEVIAHRAEHLSAVRLMLEQVDVFVFTFGLTESWMKADGQEVYAIAPGVMAGHFDPQEYRFVNQGFNEVYGDFREFMDVVGRPIRYLLTVSPVPLTATASSEHVLLANTYSKAVLRAVAGSLCQAYENVDYFPSYEIITSPATRGAYYELNMRSISPIGVCAVMSTFFQHHPSQRSAESFDVDSQGSDGDYVQCDEEVLESFS